MAIVFWALFSIILCAICSVLETVLFSARPVRLLSQTDRPGVRAFLTIREERIGDAISAVLIVNTVAGTIGPGFVGAETARAWGDPAVAVASTVLTFLILILAEIGPKTYAATHAEELAAITGHVLRPTLWALAPLLFVTRRITDWLSGDPEGAVTRNSLAQIIAYAPSQGALSRDESDALAHMLYAHHVTLADVHTPIDMVVALPEAETLGGLLDASAAIHFARIPTYADDPAKLTGYVNQRIVLREIALDAAARERTLAEFRRDLPVLRVDLSVGRAIASLLDAHEPIGAVADGSDTIGIVTLEDLFEALLGVDITDEAEEIVTQRSDADVWRRRRIERLRQRRQEWTQGAAAQPSNRT